MRLLDLQLIAFGPFTDLRLELGTGPQGLHIVYGPNEAGKSSALRGLRALLYGIPHNSADNFVHDYVKMRVGGLLRHSDDTELAFVRRKGNKNTLLNPDGTPLADGDLAKFLHGVSEELFASVFGIDHDALVRGGQSILAGAGDVGQSLFAAGMGIPNLRQILKGLYDEAATLFVPGGRAKGINLLLGEYNDARQKVKAASLKGADWADHDRALAQAIAERAGVHERIEELSAQESHLKRLRDALPKAARRRALLESLKAMGEVTVLPPEFGERHQEAAAKLVAAQEAEATAKSNLERLNVDLSKLDVPEQMIEQDGAISELHLRLGSHRKAVNDLPGLEANQRRLEAEASATLLELRPGLAIEQAREFRPTAQQRSRLQQLGRVHQKLVGKLQDAEKAVESMEKKLSQARQRLAAIPEARDTREFRRALAEIQRRGDLEGAVRKAQQAQDAEQAQGGVELRRLGLWSGTIGELEHLEVPLPKTVDRFESEFQKLAARQETLEEKRQAAQADQSEIERQIQELQTVTMVPTEEDLARARSRRERGWKLVRRVWLGGEDVSEEAKAYDPEKELPEAFESSVAESDGTSDRLRREADRVAKHASLVSERTKVLESLKRLEEQAAEAAKRLAGLEADWSKCWEHAGIRPLPPKEMRAWIDRVRDLQQRAARVRDLGSEVSRLTGEIGEARRRLAHCLEGMDEKASPAEEPLGSVMDRCSSLAEALEKRQSDRVSLAGKIGDLEGDLANAQEAKSDAADGLGGWKTDWTAAVACLNLPGDVLPTEADAVLGRQDDLLRKLDEADGLKGRIGSIQRDATKFAADVAAAVEHLAADLRIAPPELAAAELNARLARAKIDAARKSEIEKQILDNVERLRRAQDTVALMTQRLARLCEQAGCTTHSELSAAEERSSRFEGIQRDAKAVEEQLLDLGAGAAIEAIVRETEETDADALPAQIAAVARQVKELGDVRSQLDQKIGGERAELGKMDGSATAAEAAEKAQSALAAIRTGSERYVRLWTAATLLKREIERYREKNQGPLLGRASELLSRLSLGSFAGLKTDFGEHDEPILLGVRPSGALVGVAGMSDGTLDQLYLSLRLASLEKYTEANEPIPFIVDDILIRFDDDRSKATLKVLADLSLKTQVIFFTHHARLVELAHDVAGDTCLMVHRLDGARRV